MGGEGRGLIIYPPHSLLLCLRCSSPGSPYITSEVIAFFGVRWGEDQGHREKLKHQFPNPGPREKRRLRSRGWQEGQ